MSYIYRRRSRMRLSEAWDIINYAQDWGIGLDPEDEFEWEAAWFRIRGVEALDHPPDIRVTDDVSAPADVPAWERELLAPFVREFLSMKGSAIGDDQ